MDKLVNISELSEILGFTNPKTKKPLNHILRYWEKEFKQINPKIINKRRFYSKEQVETIRLIKFLLKDKGLILSLHSKVLRLSVWLLY